MLEVLIFGGLAVFVGFIWWWSRKLPWPFEHQGRKYYRYRDGRFLDAKKAPITDTAMVSVLQEAWKASKEKEERDREWDVPAAD